MRRHAIFTWTALGVLISLAVIGFTLSKEQKSPYDNAASAIENVPRISITELKNKIDTTSNLSIVDVRSISEYEKAHIPGAISIPLAEISKRYNELKGYNLVVTYCT